MKDFRPQPFWLPAMSGMGCSGGPSLGLFSRCVLVALCPSRSAPPGRCPRTRRPANQIATDGASAHHVMPLCFAHARDARCASTERAKRFSSSKIHTVAFFSMDVLARSGTPGLSRNGIPRQTSSSDSVLPLVLPATVGSWNHSQCCCGSYVGRHESPAWRLLGRDRSRTKWVGTTGRNLFHKSVRLCLASVPVAAALVRLLSGLACTRVSPARPKPPRSPRGASPHLALPSCRSQYGEYGSFHIR